MLVDVANILTYTDIIYMRLVLLVMITLGVMVVSGRACEYV